MLAQQQHSVLHQCAPPPGHLHLLPLAPASQQPCQQRPQTCSRFFSPPGNSSYAALAPTRHSPAGSAEQPGGSGQERQGGLEHSAVEATSQRLLVGGLSRPWYSSHALWQHAVPLATNRPSWQQQQQQLHAAPDGLVHAGLRRSLAPLRPAMQPSSSALTTCASQEERQEAGCTAQHKRSVRLHPLLAGLRMRQAAQAAAAISRAMVRTPVTPVTCPHRRCLCSPSHR